MFKRKPFNPWMTEALIVSRKNKAKLFNKKLRKPSLKTINKLEKNTMTINLNNKVGIVNKFGKQ